MGPLYFIYNFTLFFFQISKHHITKANVYSALFKSMKKLAELLVMMMKLPILPCAEKLELVLSTVLRFVYRNKFCLPHQFCVSHQWQRCALLCWQIFIALCFVLPTSSADYWKYKNEPTADHGLGTVTREVCWWASLKESRIDENDFVWQPDQIGPTICNNYLTRAQILSNTVQRTNSRWAAIRQQSNASEFCGCFCWTSDLHIV